MTEPTAVAGAAVAGYAATAGCDSALVDWANLIYRVAGAGSNVDDDQTI